jgi:crotonobetainyl-CoA:carnitine CoA-transferase CaiB-like acyl-CoA transferase
LQSLPVLPEEKLENSENRTSCELQVNLESELPLTGICVVEICHSIAGPYGGSILAQLGATVIKVENPFKGDDARSWGPPNWQGTSVVYHAFNRDKHGVTSDLKSLSDSSELRNFIIQNADVVLQSLRPGAIEKVGLGAAELCAQKPELIYCNIGSFGTKGPLKNRPGYDPLMQAHSGLMSVTGTEGGEPIRVGTSIIDMGTGMWAAIGILAALQKRHLSGKGGIVDTSLFETSLAWMTLHLAGFIATGERRRPMGSGLVEIVPHQAFRTLDGYVMVAAGNDTLFGRLAIALNKPDLANHPDYVNNGKRVKHRTALIATLEQCFLQEKSVLWIERLSAAGVPVAPLQTVEQVVKDSQAIATGMIQQIKGEAMSLVGLPISFNGQRPPLKHIAPLLGQHSTEILKAKKPAVKVTGR